MQSTWMMCWKRRWASARLSRKPGWCPRPRRRLPALRCTGEGRYDVGKAEFVRFRRLPAKDFPRDGLPAGAVCRAIQCRQISTIDDTLLQRKNFARVSASPGKTVFVNLFRIDERVWFVDPPGYGYARVSQRERERFSRLIEEYMNADRQNVGRAY